MSNFLSNILLLCCTFIGSLCASTLLIKFGIPRLKKNNIEQTMLQQVKPKIYFFDIGLFIGFFETIIIFIFVLNKEFSGLALIFSAKELVRKDEIQKDPAYYLLGTLINFSVALVAAELYGKYH